MVYGGNARHMGKSVRGGDMKRLLPILFLLCLPLALLAQDKPVQVARMGPVMVGGSAGTAASYTWSCIDADIMCEDFDGASVCGDDAAGATNCQETWDVTETASATVVFATAGTACTGKGTYVALLDDADAAAFGAYMVYDAGASKTETWTQLYFKATEDLAANARTMKLVSICSNATCSSEAVSVKWYRVGAGAYRLDVVFNAKTYSSTATNLALNKWYGLRLYYKVNDAAGIAAYYQDDVTTDSWTQITIADATTTTTAAQYWYHSGAGSATADVANLFIDMIKVRSATGYPAASCP